jgi:hypothetical protein
MLFTSASSAVEQQRRSTNGGIGIAVAEGQRSSAYSRIETAVAIAKERKPTKACISRTGGEQVKCIAS